MRQHSQAYWIPPHVRACGIGAGAVLLDLERNRYFGIGEKEAHALFTLAAGRSDAPGRTAHAGEPLAPETLAPIAEALVQAGLLSREAPADRAIAPAAIDLSGTLTSIGHELDRCVAIRFSHAANFVRACAWARRALRTRPLYSIVRQLSVEKVGCPDYFDVERAIGLVGVFRRLRPYAFAARGQCLFHALSLVRFLACYELFPAWVIGVRTHPWAAHSWVQQDRLVLDSSPEHIGEYTPILTV